MVFELLKKMAILKFLLDGFAEKRAWRGGGVEG
jgi:hypothetical protein